MMTSWSRKLASVLRAGAGFAAAIPGAPAASLTVSRAERFAAAPSGQVEAEARAWPMVDLPMPPGVVLEASAVLPLGGGRLLATSRRGELWFIDGAYANPPAPRYSRFAAGLHEPLGLAAAREGGFHVVQRSELTLVQDRDGDGQADLFRTVCRLPVSGNYHEFAFGPFPAPGGNVRVTLMLAYNAQSYSPVPWRGWMLEITPEGRMIPIAAGFRAGAGVVHTSQGLWLATENQGEWMGTSHVTEIRPGDFVGHPASLAWSRLPGSPLSLRPEDIPDAGEPFAALAQRIPGLKPPTVGLPYAVLGISPTDIVEDTTGGRFGPYAGHFFVGDAGQSRILRVTLEQVRGVWQGAAYPFRAGFASGVARLRFGEDGSLFVGQTARGWGSVGGAAQALQRVRWSGATPFALHEVIAQPDGFLLRFTAPVERTAAGSPASYRISGFTYQHHSRYGSAPIGRVSCPVRRLEVAPDGRSVRLAVACLREGYIHEIRAAGVRAEATGDRLLHDTAYYTLNRRPEGARITPPDPAEAEWCGPAVPPAALAPTPKRPADRPAHWSRPQGDRTVLLSAQPGMRFDRGELRVKAGEAVQFVFRNEDDMLHNFVLCRPGRGAEVGRAALALGLEGAARNYVPDSPDVIVHTAVVLPGDVDRLYFTAPGEKGRYDFLCTVPGHFLVMKGILIVE